MTVPKTSAVEFAKPLFSGTVTEHSEFPKVGVVVRHLWKYLLSSPRYPQNFNNIRPFFGTSSRSNDRNELGKRAAAGFGRASDPAFVLSSQAFSYKRPDLTCRIGAAGSRSSSSAALSTTCRNIAKQTFWPCCGIKPKPSSRLRDCHRGNVCFIDPARPRALGRVRANF